MWDKIVHEVNEEVPPFNDYLLLKFRSEKLKQIPEYFSMMLAEGSKLLPGVKYLGYTELSPEEYLQKMLSEKSNGVIRGVDINPLNVSMLRYEFEFSGTKYEIFRQIPFMRNRYIEMYGKRYYPIFPVGERGGVHRSANSVIAKVMRAPLTFWRNTPVVFSTMSGKICRELIPTTKIYFGSTGSNKNKPPLLLYLLSKFGFYETLNRLGIPGRIIISETYRDDLNAEGWEHIKVAGCTQSLEDKSAPRICYIIAHKNDLQDQHMRSEDRVIKTVASLYSILTFYKKFEYRDLVNSLAYYVAALGKYNNPAISKDISLMENATNHIAMNDTLLDLVSIQQLQTVGIYVNDFYEFITKVYLEIDEWLNNYNPINQFDKKIGSLDQMMGGEVRKLFSKIYRIINNRNVGVNHATVRKFTRSASYSSNWLHSSSIFRCNPSRCNDNWLLGIGAKRIRTLQNTEIGSGSNVSRATLPVALLKAHHSQLVVESALDIPTSSPITSGSINPYLQITESGDIITPDWVDDISEIYK